MIRILDVDDTIDEKVKEFLNKEYDSFEDFVTDIKSTYYIVDVGVTSKDNTVGWTDLENKFDYTKKAYMWFEDVNIINPKKYKKYL